MERSLLLKFKEAREKCDQLKEELKLANIKKEQYQLDLIEYLEENKAKATRKYDGIGYAQIEKPRLYASCGKDNEKELFEFLERQERMDLIKTGVNSQTLSSYVRELMDQGDPIPEFISYYFQDSLKIYASKEKK